MQKFDSIPKYLVHCVYDYLPISYLKKIFLQYYYVVDFKANKSMLLKILFLVIFTQVVCGKEEATLGEFPWTVSLRLSGFVGHDCGGAILNSVKLNEYETENLQKL